MFQGGFVVIYADYTVVIACFHDALSAAADLVDRLWNKLGPHKNLTLAASFVLVPSLSTSPGGSNPCLQ